MATVDVAIAEDEVQGKVRGFVLGSSGILQVPILHLKGLTVNGYVWKMRAIRKHDSVGSPYTLFHYTHHTTIVIIR